MATENQDARDMPWWELTLWLLGTLVVLVAIGYGLWWVGNWLWDVIGAFFGWLFGGGSRGDLEYYCSYKYNSTTSALYRMCVEDGWKDWYANAHWMK